MGSPQAKQLKRKLAPRQTGLNRGWLMVALVLFVSACSPSPPDPNEFPTALPCDQPAQQVELGSPHREDPPATFTVDGRTVWATFGRGTPAGGIFSEIDHGVLSIGHQETPPSYDAVSGRLENEQVRERVYVGRFTELMLASGDYWALHSVGVGELTLFSCEPGVISNPDRSR